MTVIAKAQCQKCQSAIDIAYVLLGSTVTCSNCLALTVPIIPTGGTYPQHVNELRYSDFIGILTERSVQNSLQKWFGFEVRNENTRDLILNSKQEAVDPLWLHLNIQSDESKRSEIYNLAMSIWHS